MAAFAKRLQVVFIKGVAVLSVPGVEGIEGVDGFDVVDLLGGGVAALLQAVGTDGITADV